MKTLRQVLRWIHDEATAPTASLAVAESRLRVCARYAKGGLKPNLQVENSTKFACSERVSPDGRRVKVGITRAGLTVLEFVRHEGAAEIRTRVLLSPEAVYNMLLCMGDAQKLSVLFCDSKPVPVVKKRKKAKR